MGQRPASKKHGSFRGYANKADVTFNALTQIYAAEKETRVTTKQRKAKTLESDGQDKEPVKVDPGSFL